MNICEFCKKELSSKSSLLYHQRTARYCLEIQGKSIEDFNCKYCDKEFTTTQNLNEHYTSCKVKKEQDRNTIEEKIQISYQTKIKNMEEKYKMDIFQINKDNKIQIEFLNISISQKDQIIEKLEKKLESYEKKIFDMASRPTNTNNNKTIVINNIPLTNEVLRQSAKTFSIDYAKNINDITRHFKESLEDHITCTDSSRNIFKYTNEKEEEIVDTDLENIIPQYLTAIKDENNFLYKEVFDYFKTNNVCLSQQTDYNIFYNALNAIIEKKGDKDKYSEKMKKHIVRECKKQFLEKNKKKEKEITKELTDEEVMMNIIRNGGSLYEFIDRLFDIEDIDNETDEEFEYRRKMEDLFKQKKKEWKDSNLVKS
jgi:hypothetical protein